MDTQTELLTSIRDILTRIERVLARIEAAGQVQGADAATPEDAEPAVSEPAATPSARPVVSTAPPMTGRGKWRQR